MIKGKREDQHPPYSFHFPCPGVRRRPGGARGKEGEDCGSESRQLTLRARHKSSPIKILRIGEEVDVERLEGSWYRVSLPDGKSGYVYKPLVYLSGHEEAESIQAGNAPGQEHGVSKGIAVKGTNGAEGKSRSRAPRRQIEFSQTNPVEKDSPKDNPPLTMGIGQERLLVIVIWITAALCIFILGWILGGNYYLRRDRIYRSKLHF